MRTPALDQSKPQLEDSPEPLQAELSEETIDLASAKLQNNLFSKIIQINEC